MFARHVLLGGTEPFSEVIVYHKMYNKVNRLKGCINNTVEYCLKPTNVEKIQMY